MVIKVVGFPRRTYTFSSLSLAFCSPGYLARCLVPGLISLVTQAYLLMEGSSPHSLLGMMAISHKNDQHGLVNLRAQQWHAYLYNN